MPTAISTTIPSFSQKVFCEDSVASNGVNITIFPILEKKQRIKFT